MRPNRLEVTTVLAIVALTLAGTASAAAPEVVLGTATVDGDYSEWDLSADFFANMLRAAGQGGQTDVLSKVYMRYNPDTSTLYVLVLTEETANGYPGFRDADEAWVKIDGAKMVDGNSATFAWIEFAPPGEYVKGYEASFYLPQGTYLVNVHINVLDYNEPGESQTSGTIKAGTEIHVVPELPLVGTIGASLAMLAALALKMKRKPLK